MRKNTPPRTRWIGALRWLCTLLLLTVAFFAWVSVSGFDQKGHPRCDDNGKCYDPDDVNKGDGSGWISQNQADPDKRFATIEGDTDLARPGQTVNRTIVGHGSSSLPLTITYTPPYGATNLTFDPAPEPGGPPYVWRNVQESGDLITISYEAPPIEGEWTQWKAVETVQSTAPGSAWRDRTDRYETTIILPNQAVIRPRAVTSVPGLFGADDPESVTVWNLQRWIEFPGVALDSDDIRHWAEWLAADDVFFAMRLPIEPGVPPTRSVALPWFTDGDHPASLRIERYGGELFYETTLELRPDRMTFAANALPQAEGEVWTTLGVASEVQPVADGISVEADLWSMIVELSFDLSAQPSNGAGLIQPIYYCYDSTDRPVASRRTRVMAYALGGRYEGGLAATSFPDWCITCMGPQQLSTVTAGYGWGLGHTGSELVQAGDEMVFKHTVSAMRDADVAVTFSVTSTLNLDWTLYEGDGVEPDLEAPLTGAYEVRAGAIRYVWLVSDPVPEGVADGPYSVTLTADDGQGATRWASDVFWVGEWVSPATSYLAHVPLIIKEP